MSVEKKGRSNDQQPSAESSPQLGFFANVRNRLAKVGGEKIGALAVAVGLMNACDDKGSDKTGPETTSAMTMGESDSEEMNADETGVGETGKPEDGSSTGENNEGDSTDADDNDATTGAPEGDASTGSTGEEMTDETTGISSTGEVPAECPEDACMDGNTQNCEMDGVTPICNCKEGYVGSCDSCAPTHEMIEGECVLDTTPPKAATITAPNNGGNSLIIEDHFNLQSDINGNDIKKVYYRENLQPFDIIDEVKEPLIQDLNYKPGENKLNKEFTDIPIDKTIQYEVVVEDGNGNRNDEEYIQVTRVNP